MLEASPNMVKGRQGLFLIDGGVHHDVTSFFLGTDPGVQEQLIGVVNILREEAEKYEATETGPNNYPGRKNTLIADKSLDKTVRTYRDLHRRYEGSLLWFRDELTAHRSEELEVIQKELTGILNGEIVLTDSQRQQLSNLSNGTMMKYLSSLGIDLKDLSFPLLDVGTGKEALFAQGVVNAFPDERVVSTSMHLLSPTSSMSRKLSGQTDRGELIACSGIDMPFEDETFGMVVSLNADPYYTPRRSLLESLQEKRRVLKVGGVALLCPALCEYGDLTITQTDLEPLQSEMDITIAPIPKSGRQFYDSDVQEMLVIKK